MRIDSNVPRRPFLTIDGYPCIATGDQVRIVLKADDERYPYSRGGYIGIVQQIAGYWFSIKVYESSDCYEGTSVYEKKLFFDEVFLIKRVSNAETFENTPYYDEAERQFWEDYWWTADGITRKTDEDKRKLKEFRRQFE